MISRSSPTVRTVSGPSRSARASGRPRAARRSAIAAAQQPRRDEQRDPIDQAGGDEGAVDGGAALDQHRLDAAARASVARARRDARRRRGAGDHQRRRGAVEDVARAGQRRAARPARRAAGAAPRRRPGSRTVSRGIVGPHRPRADQHGVVRGAQLVRGPPRRRPRDPDAAARRRAARRRRCSRPASPPPSASPAAAARAPRSRRRGSPRGTRVSRQPTSTRTPARRSRAMPLPSTSGFGSPQPTTTRAEPAPPAPPRCTARCGRRGSTAPASRTASRRAPPRPAAQRVQRVHLGVRLAGAPVETLAR